jgi:MoxR-like ATPase
MENHKELPNRIKGLLAYLNSMLSGKEEAMRLTLLSAIAGENIFLWGSSGFDKMILVRCVARAFQSHYRYDYEHDDNDNAVLSYCNKATNISGHVGYYSYFNEYNNYLIEFIDSDIWKVSHNRLEDSDTFLAVASQKTLPFNLSDKVLEEYIALHVQVNSASNDEAFFKFVENTDDYVLPTQEMFETLLISNEDIENWRKEIDKVRLGDDAKNLISEIRRESFEYFVSDFRWKKIVHILKTCAFLNGRTKVDLVDCSLIDYAIPNHVVEGILKQKAINSELDRKQHPQYKANIFASQKYYDILKASINDKKLQLEHETEI